MISLVKIEARAAISYRGRLRLESAKHDAPQLRALSSFDDEDWSPDQEKGAMS